MVLRALRAGDARSVHEAYASDPEATRFLAWRAHKSLAETRRYLRQTRITAQQGTEHLWALLLKRGGLIGAAGIRPCGSRIEIGYVLGRAWWGRGYATEAARALTAWAMRQPSVYRVWATCDVDNKASARVLEKIGMTREGVLRKWIVRPALGPAPRDSFCYSIVKAREKRRAGNRQGAARS
ncbi:MAG TPA: GNAT family N-acetyltransferase [Kiritimatiellia bacterium]|nr:GNAT family N-acetyltransferase [Kiritimatiellia bacterium]HRZ11313.1 GNAT family N-acetyltransferase [Kiritimatiellia bacterium]HSA17136.1 GNAT family N-acetyltransferase [Kiritimatiellia bacterium]